MVNGLPGQALLQLLSFYPSICLVQLPVSCCKQVKGVRERREKKKKKRKKKEKKEDGGGGCGTHVHRICLLASEGSRSDEWRERMKKSSGVHLLHDRVIYLKRL